MSAEEILAAEIDDRPQQLVDYADENEIGELYAALYRSLRNPYGSDQQQDAEAFLMSHICRAIQSHADKNREWAEEQAKAALDEAMTEAA